MKKKKERARERKGRNTIGLSFPRRTTVCIVRREKKKILSLRRSSLENNSPQFALKISVSVNTTPRSPRETFGIELAAEGKGEEGRKGDEKGGQEKKKERAKKPTAAHGGSKNSTNAPARFPARPRPNAT